MVISYLQADYCWGYTIEVFAVEDDVVVGKVCVEFLKDTEPYVSGLIVKEKKRKQGIGTCLLNYCEDVALRSGFDTVRLGIEADDDYARDFYAKRGYSTVKEMGWETDYGKYETMRKQLNKDMLKEWDLNG